ncbi:hypothetical protein HNP72_001898 [Sphingobacterium soli]|nr:hypothetical protein [Sphingobacterium soli]
MKIALFLLGKTPEEFNVCREECNMKISQGSMLSIPGFLQICRPAGAGCWQNDLCYRYVAPLGLVNECLNIRRWAYGIRLLIIG